MAQIELMSKYDWLEERNGFVGCKVCQSAGRRGRLAQFAATWKELKTSNIKRHADLKTHRNAAARLGLAGTAGQIKDVPKYAPDESEFRRVWENTLRGQALQPVLNGIDTRKKDRLMQ